MQLEDQVLGQRIFREAALMAYGFEKTASGYRFSQLFCDNAFRAEVEIGRDGHFRARCIDCETEDVYMPIYIHGHGGTFVATVRAEYLKILSSISEACGDKLPFLKAQTNRLASLFFEKFGESADFPFKNDEVDGVFRNAENRKWYALVMRLTRGKVEKTDSDEIIEVISFKASAEDHAFLLKKRGFLPAYHMGKSTWLTVILDDTVDDAEILKYIEKSRAFTVGKAQVQKRGSVEHKAWLIPANCHYYDVDKAFDARDVIEWKQSSLMHVGDIVYMYISSPISAITYQCEVVEMDIPFEYEDKNIKIHKEMRIKKLYRFADDAYPLERLKTFGVNSIRGPRGVPDALLKAMEADIARESKKARCKGRPKK